MKTRSFSLTVGRFEGGLLADRPAGTSVPFRSAKPWSGPAAVGQSFALDHAQRQIEAERTIAALAFGALTVAMLAGIIVCSIG